MSNYNDSLILPDHVQSERAPKLVSRWLLTLELTTMQRQVGYEPKAGDDAPVIPIIVRESVVSDVSPIVYLSEQRYVEIGNDENGPIDWVKCVVLFAQNFGMMEETPEAMNQKIIGA